MTGRNWSKARSRELMRDRGVDDIKDQSAPYIPTGKPRKPRPSKAEMRAELERLMAVRERSSAAERKGR